MRARPLTLRVRCFSCASGPPSESARIRPGHIRPRPVRTPGHWLTQWVLAVMGAGGPSHPAQFDPRPPGRLFDGKPKLLRQGSLDWLVRTIQIRPAAACEPEPTSRAQTAGRATTMDASGPLHVRAASCKAGNQRRDGGAAAPAEDRSQRSYIRRSRRSRWRIGPDTTEEPRRRWRTGAGGDARGGAGGGPGRRSGARWWTGGQRTSSPQPE